MVNYSYVQSKVYYANGKCASKIGQVFSQYRAPNGINPIIPDNFLQNLNMSANVTWDYMKANKYGNSLWQLIVDGSKVITGDFLIGNGQEWFVTAHQPLLPINGIQCNTRVSLFRPTLPLSAGSNPYGGYESGQELSLLENCPISYLASNKQEGNPLKLPLDSRVPKFDVYMPLLTSFEPRIGDLIEDTRGVRSALTSVEKTDLGFRCTAVSQQF